MLKRKAYEQINTWKKSKTCQALLVMGARQVGKTTTIREFAKDNYDAVAEINFFQNPEAKETVAAAADEKDLLLRISALSRTDLTQGDALIFLDEVQELSDALTVIKFLVQQTRADVILSGSLLGLDAFPAKSLPVGYLQTIEMFPLDFEEYCWARSIPNAVFSQARQAFVSKEAIPTYIHELFMDEFYKYLLVGGMPNAVQAFIDSNVLIRTRNAQQAIAEMYKYDIVKYINDKTESRQIELVYESIPGQLNAQNKRFKYTRLGKNLRFANLETAFDWLKSAGIALEVQRVTEPVFPLGLNTAQAAFKLYLNDVGLLTAQLMGDADISILNKRANINFGSIFENAAAQELRAHEHALYYYNSRAIGEVDFVLQDNLGDITLVEIKSGKDYQRHIALNNLLNTKNYNFKNVIVFYDGNLVQRERVLYAPIYTIGFI